MRILHILHGRELAGMEKLCIDLCNAMAKNNNVMLLAGEQFQKYISLDVEYISLNLEKSRNNILFLYRLYSIIRTFSPDIIHVHKQKSIFIIKRLEKFLSIPFVATKHDVKRKKAFHNLEYAITITDEVSHTIQAKNIYKIYNGIPYYLPKKISLPDTFNIVAVGGLKPIKAFDRLIDVISKLSFPCHLTLVGEGKLREIFIKKIRMLNIEEKVTLVGFVDNVQDYLYSADLQVISSISEGFSLAMVEGIFYAPRMISTKVSGATEILPKSLLYNIEDLQDKIEDVYHNQDSYEKKFKEVKNKYKLELTIEVCAEKHINIYSEIIKDFNAKSKKIH